MQQPNGLVAPMLGEKLDEPGLRSQLEALEKLGNHVAEAKYDGERIMVRVEGGKVVQARGRNGGAHILRRFPEVTEILPAALGVEGSVVLDAEVGFLDQTGLRMHFNTVQERARVDMFRVSLHARMFPMSLAVFDILEHGGVQVWPRPYVERRQLLESVVRETGRVILAKASPRIVEFYDQVTRFAGEGVMLKMRSSPYVPGQRSKYWFKAKTPGFVDELHAVGLQEGEGRRGETFGAFILAREEAGELVYVCNAGSGLSDAVLNRVMARVSDYATGACPLREMPKLDKPVKTWLRPGITCDIRFDPPVKFKPRFPRVTSVRIGEETVLV